MAKDGIRVIVQADNPLEDLTADMLADIYSGDTANWADTKEE